MADDKKSTSPVLSALSTGGIGAILSAVVAYMVPDSNSGLAKLLYVFVPLSSALLTYIMNWVVARHGLESPEDAAMRSQCMRDLKTIEAQLARADNTPEFRTFLQKNREKTIAIMISIGKNSTSTPLITTTDRTDKSSS